MKSTIKLLLLTLVVSGLQFGISGCVGEVGVNGGGGYYGGGGPWFVDGGWMDGGRWGGRDGGRDGGHEGGGGIHPPGQRR